MSSCISTLCKIAALSRTAPAARYSRTRKACRNIPGQKFPTTKTGNGMSSSKTACSAKRKKIRPLSRPLAFAHLRPVSRGAHTNAASEGAKPCQLMQRVKSSSKSLRITPAQKLETGFPFDYTTSEEESFRQLVETCL